MEPGPFRVEATRGGIAESVHTVVAAVVDADGRQLAAAGNPELVTWWRSAAKPFQALPLLLDGAADHFGFGDEELAMACASHSSEPRHLEAVDRMMAKAGVTEGQLACGIHPPLSPAVAKVVARGAAVMTPRWSNCSGKHTGMLALAKHHGWDTADYQLAGHPVQERVLDEVIYWTGLSRAEVGLGVDGCTVACFALPVARMALAYALWGAAREANPRRLLQAVMAHPFLIAGTGRLCTDLMLAWPGRVMAKIGADGVYCATLPELGWGVALKVTDGDIRSSAVALVELLRQLIERQPPEVRARYPFEALAGHARQPIRNTRDAETGELRAAGALRFFAAAGV
jgi:L-asparaginase II